MPADTTRFPCCPTATTALSLPPLAAAPYREGAVRVDTTFAAAVGRTVMMGSEPGARDAIPPPDPVRFMPNLMGGPNSSICVVAHQE